MPDSPDPAELVAGMTADERDELRQLTLVRLRELDVELAELDTKTAEFVEDLLALDPSDFAELVAEDPDFADVLDGRPDIAVLRAEVALDLAELARLGVR